MLEKTCTGINLLDLKEYSHFSKRMTIFFKQPHLLCYLPHCPFPHVPEPPADLPSEGGLSLLLHPDDGHPGYREGHCIVQTFIKVF